MNPETHTSHSGVVLFDNTGTLSDSIKINAFVHPQLERPPNVPFVPETDRRLAQVNVRLDGPTYGRFEGEPSMGSVFSRHDVALHLALSNTETTLEEVRAVLASSSLPGATVCRALDRALEAFADHPRTEVVTDGAPGSDVPAGVQVVVDLDDRLVLRAFGYATVPRPDASAVVAEVREFGYVPHIVSGDAHGILRRVGDELAVPPENLHPYQSASDKAAVVTQFDGATVMVGDYVNDRLAFEVADLGIFVDNHRDDGGRTTETLAPIADHVVEELEEVPSILARQPPV